MIRPVIDEVTEITYDEAQDVLDYFDEKEVRYIDLAKDDATRENVEKGLKTNPNMSVLHYDHGNKTSWIGEDGAVVDLENVELLRDRQCYCDNCSSAAKLGVEAWKLGAVYWGYKEIFMFTTDSLEEFKTAVNFGIKRHIDGFSWKECLEEAKAKMTELADKLVAEGKILAASCMRRDRDIMVCYTADSPPEPEEPSCPLRRLAVRLFGTKVGWKITRKWAVSIAIFFLGFGISLHDFCHALWEVGGYPKILSWQGGYIGYVLMLIAFLLATYEYVQWLKKSD